MKIDIVPYNPSDQPDFKKLVLDGLKELGFDYDPKFDSDLDNPYYYIENGGRIFLAKLDKKLIGSLVVINREDGLAELKRFYINKDYQHQGIGSLLYDKAIEFCGENNFKRIELESNKKFKTAHEFYLKRGFKIFREDEESLYMEKSLAV